MAPTINKPANYGAYWETGATNEDWYADIFSSRPKAHERFTTWFSELYRLGDPMSSVIEVGCGRAQFYPTLFRSHQYTGIDISSEAIKWCHAHYKLEEATFIAADVIQTVPDVKADMVYSHAVIDHVYDIDGFVKSLAQMAKKWVYISAYYGWYPELDAHEQTWRETDTCFYNKLSPKKLRAAIESMGGTNIQIFPFLVENPDCDNGFETVIIFSPPL